MRLEKI